MIFLNRIKFLYKKYKHFIDFNKELIIAEIAAFIFGAGFAEISSLLTGNLSYIAITSSVGDFLGFGLGYGVSSYLDKRERYTKNLKEFFKDMLKFIGGGVFASAIYYILRTYLVIFFQTIGFEPYQASVSAQLLSTIVFFGLMNIFGYAVGLIKR